MHSAVGISAVHGGEDVKGCSALTSSSVVKQGGLNNAKRAKVTVNEPHGSFAAAEMRAVPAASPSPLRHKLLRLLRPLPKKELLHFLD